MRERGVGTVSGTRRALGAALAVFWLIQGALALGQNAEGEESGSGEPKTADARVELTAFRADVTPRFEVVLPTGVITQHVPLELGAFRIDTSLGYSFNANTLSGDIVFSYAFGPLRPALHVFQKVDFEDYVSPRLAGGNLQLAPEERFVSRWRGIEPRVSVEPLPNTRLSASFGITDVFKGSLSRQEVTDEGINLLPQIALSYDGMRAVDPDRMLRFSGISGRTALRQRFRGNLRRPVLLETENRVVAQYNPSPRWSIEEHLSVDSMIRVWERDLVEPYQLGGYTGIRGYRASEIRAVRVAMLAQTFSRQVLPELELEVPIGRKQRATLHQYRLFLVNELAVTQEDLAVDSPLSFYGSIGGGLGMTVSLRWIHLDLSATLAQAFDAEERPVFYLQTRLFSFEG